MISHFQDLKLLADYLRHEAEFIYRHESLIMYVHFDT